ncbi:MAG: uncharacterized protein JWQ53_1113 [Klenkia sp.]|nr:uncharacterized protein [Klenkia sp.]
MSSVISTRRARLSRTPLVLAAGLAAALVLAGCGGGAEEGTASPASSGSASSAATESEESSAAVDLAAGLLPAGAFGEGVTVSPLTEEQIAQGAALAGDPADITITPESCARAVAGTQLRVEDLGDFAAQGAQGPSSIVVELISTGGPDDQVGSLAAAAEACPEATLSSPAIGTATVTFTAVDVPDLGDESAAVSYSDRLVTLSSTSLGGAPDEAAFGPLLQQAHVFQADALD